MTGNSLIKELSGENINIQTTIASLGLSVLVLAFSIIGLAGFQPAEASDGVLSVLSSKPQVLGAQDYQMQVVYSGSTLDLAVTPYDFDSSTGKWNYKVSWNRKSGTVGNLNINGNLFYQGAQGINEAYTGYSLSPSSSYSISYSYLAKSGKKYITKVLTKKTFSTLKAISANNSSISQLNTNTTVQQLPADPNKTTISVAKPAFGEVVDKNMQISFVFFSPKSEAAGTVFYSLLSTNSGTNLGESNIPLTTISAGEQQGTFERNIDTSQVPSGSYTLTIGIDLKGGTKLYASNITVNVNHTNSNSLGVFSITSPASSSTWVGDNPINIVASGNSSVGFLGSFSTYIDNALISTGSGEKSADSKSFSLSTTISNIPSAYIFGLTEGPHTLLVKAGLLDNSHFLSDTKTIIFSKPTSTPLSSVVTTVRQYSDDINEDGVIDYKDSTYLNSVISGTFACPSPNNCDVNGDGVLTIADAVAFRQIFVNRYDFDKDGVIAYSDYIKMGDVVPGIIACPVTTCDFVPGGGITLDDWKQLGKILSTFPGITVY
jgi:hypothetical protein